VPSLLRFGVGPLLATPTDTKAAYEPFFAWLAGQLGTKHELTAVDSWGGISVALGTNQLDLAWMGPFGYVLATPAPPATTVRHPGQARRRCRRPSGPVWRKVGEGRGPVCWSARRDVAEVDPGCRHSDADLPKTGLGIVDLFVAEVLGRPEGVEPDGVHR